MTRQGEREMGYIVKLSPFDATSYGEIKIVIGSYVVGSCVELNTL